MSSSATTANQPSLFWDEEAAEIDVDAARSLLDQLLADSRLYRGTLEYRSLLDLIVRLRNFAPFNAMLLQIQKPGLMYAASARDWGERFERWPKEDARPLLILCCYRRPASADLCQPVRHSGQTLGAGLSD